jgi:hypothetical protein
MTGRPRHGPLAATRVVALEDVAVAVPGNVMSKKTSITYLWWLFLGLFGAHYFYLGKRRLGWLYLCTVGLLGIGWLIDDDFPASWVPTWAYGLKPAHRRVVSVAPVLGSSVPSPSAAVPTRGDL